MGMEWGQLATQIRSTPEDGDTLLVIRRYRHPDWPARPVVRVLPEEVVVAEDARQAAFGFAPVGEPESVGAVPQPTLGFPEWPLRQDPRLAEHASARMHDLDRIARLAASRPKDAVAVAEKAAAELDATVPSFAPTFLEEAARALIRHDRTVGARRLIGRARRLERTHDLPIDEDRHRAALLEFSAADALPAKELSEEARRLGRALPPEEAFRALLGLAAARAEAGGAPPTDLPKDVARLGRAAGLTEAEAHRELLECLLSLPATADAPVGFWTALAASVQAWGGEEPAVLDRLLALPRTDLALEEWLEFLQRVGAADRLVDGSPVEIVEEWLRHTLAVSRHPRRWFRKHRGATDVPQQKILHRLRLPEGHQLPADIVTAGTYAAVVDALLGAGARVQSVTVDRYGEDVKLPVDAVDDEGQVLDLPHIAALPLDHPVRRAVVADLHQRLRFTSTDVKFGGPERLEGKRALMEAMAGQHGNSALIRQWTREWRASDNAATAPAEMRALVEQAHSLAGEGSEVLAWPETPAVPAASLAAPAAEPKSSSASPVPTAPPEATPAPDVREGWWAPHPGIIPMPDWLVTEFYARADRYDPSGPHVLPSAAEGASAPHAAVGLALMAAAHLPLDAQRERERVADALEELAVELRRVPDGEVPGDRIYPEWTPEMRLPQARTMLGLPSRAKERFLEHVDGPWDFTAGEYDEQLTFTPSRVADWSLERRRVDQVQGDPVEKATLAAVLLCSGELDAVIQDLRSRPEQSLPHPDAAPADPLVSAPEAVAAAARAHGLTEDAARYWLQLLALPGPKHPIVQRTNGWTPARRKKAAAHLLEAGLIVQSRRARAGRDLFLPGGWAEGAGDALPMETWKRPLFLLHQTPKVSPRLGHVVHTRPMSDVYRAVWERVAGGDAPGLQDPSTGGTP